MFDHWLTQKATVDEVIEKLAVANFDPEFYKHYESEIANAFRTREAKVRN